MYCGALPSPLAAAGKIVGDARNELQSIESLQKRSPDADAHVTLRGIVTLTREDLIYLQDETGGMRVEPATLTPLALGDEVEVKGIYFTHGESAMVTQAVVERLWPGSPPVPLSVRPEQAADGFYQNRLIQTEGTILQRSINAGRLGLLLEESGQVFEANLDLESSGNNNRLLQAYLTGSHLQMTGIAVAPSWGPHAQGGGSFTLLLRSTDDLRVLAGPPFWTGMHVTLLFVVGLLLLLLLQRAYMYSMRLRFQAINNERLRLAREMHDTLAQEFNGIALQIQNAHALIDQTSDQPLLQEHLDVALQMVRHSSLEAQTSIFVLRSLAQHSHNLLESLRGAAKQQSGHHGPRIEAQQEGDAFALDDDAMHEILRIGQEAITNAIKHARCRNIVLKLTFRSKQQVSLTISDDGIGFDTQSPLPAGHFGLRGLQERAARIGADLRIDSMLTRGTVLTLTLNRSHRPDMWHHAAMLRRRAWS